MDNKSIFENISEIKENLRLYLETKMSYYGMSAFEKAVKALTVITSKGFVLVFVMLALIFFSAAGAIYIGEILENIVLGLLAVGGMHLFLGIVFYVFRRRIFSPFIISLLINVLFKEDEDDFTGKK